MKQVMKRSLSIVLVLAMVLSLCATSFSTVSAEAVVPRAVQRQWETKWKSVYYGGRTVYDTACGIFAIVNAVGYVTGNEMSVTEVCQWAYNIKAFNYYAGGTSRNDLYPYLEAKYGKQYGFTVDHNNGQGYWSGASSTKLKNHLAAGGVAIGHVYGHFIAVVGYDSATNKFHIYDSAPSSSRGTNTYGATGLGDCWVTQSWLSTSAKLTLDWFVLVKGTGNPINLDYGEDPEPGTSADKIGTYYINSKAPASDPLNVRSGAGTSYDIVGTVKEGDLVYVSELSGSWGKLKKMDGSVTGWASLSNYADYIGVDVLGGTGAAVWGDFSTSVDQNGQFTIVNHSTTDTVGFDFHMPIAIGTKTTPYLSLQITPNYGNGYYFGITQNGSGYFMMRDCNSGDQLVVENSAPYMKNQETLEINVQEWWQPANGQTIDTVRFYVAPDTSITINYCYFAATSKKVTDTTYNLVRGTATLDPTPALASETLMDPETISIVDRNKAGSYIYDNGTLTVNADSADGYEVKFDVNKSFRPEELDYWLFSVSSEVRYDIEMVVTTATGDKTVSLMRDFWPELCTAPDGNYLPAASQSCGLNLKSVYTYNNIMPADGVSVVKSVTVKAGGKGTLTVGAIQIANEDVLSVYNDGVYKTDATTGVAMMGDVNGDSAITTADARLILQYSVGSVVLDAVYVKAADFNNDGTVSTLDARDLLCTVIL